MKFIFRFHEKNRKIFLNSTKKNFWLIKMFSVRNKNNQFLPKNCCCSNLAMPKVLTCFTPICSSVEGGQVSLVLKKGLKKISVSNSPYLARLPKSAIIDSIEYSGLENFHLKGEFDIGFGQLNGKILSRPFLIERGNSQIANEIMGGHYNFISTKACGENSKPIPEDSFINFETIAGDGSHGLILDGFLRVDIYYHQKNVIE
jgi:hypothetical protein